VSCRVHSINLRRYFSFQARPLQATSCYYILLLKWKPSTSLGALLVAFCLATFNFKDCSHKNICPISLSSPLQQVLTDNSFNGLQLVSGTILPLGFFLGIEGESGLKSHLAPNPPASPYPKYCHTCTPNSKRECHTSHLAVPFTFQASTIQNTISLYKNVKAIVWHIIFQ